MSAQRLVTLDSPGLDLDSVLGASEDLSAGPEREAPAWQRAASRIADSPIVVGAATLVGGLLLAGVVAGLVATTTDAATSRPASAVVPAAVDGPSSGDARQGLSSDASSRRGPGATVASGPSTGDARRGLTPDASALRSGRVTTYAAPDSADSADRRAGASPTALDR
jgi:hypothetical protein